MEKPGLAAKNDFWGAVVVTPSRETEDPKNAGIRREPELPKHENVIKAPTKTAQEFDVSDDEDNDDAQRLRGL